MSVPQPKLSKSVLTTLAYSAHFGFPLTLEEIHLRLNSSKPYSVERVFRTLRLMLKSKHLGQTGEYYYLSGQKNLIEQRQRNSITSLRPLTTAQQLAIKLSHVPGVLAIYLTGSLAMSNSTKDSDIDFMIITKPGRLWTTRFILTLYTSLLGLRRTPHSLSFASKLCLNLYLTSMSYELPHHKQSLYTAYELIQAVPLYDPSDTRSQLLSANSWIHDYLPNAPKGSDLKGSAQPRQYVEWGRSDPIGAVLESILYHLQLLYMRHKITSEYITPDSAFFHPHNPAPKF